MKRTTILSIAALALIFASCRQHGLELMNPTVARYDTPSEQFKVVWRTIDNGYAFWDIDPTNWDSLYRVYIPRFEELDELVKSGNYIPTEKLQAYYTDMCQHFVDHHMAIRVLNLWQDPEDPDGNIVLVHPGQIEVEKRPYYHDRFSDSLLLSCIEKIEKTERHFVAGSNADGDQSALVCNFDGIAYLKLSGYMLTGAFQSSDSLSVCIREIYLQFHQWCAAKDLRGIILDNRGNIGGSLSDMDFVVSPFLQNDMLLGHTRRKEGLGRYDYTPWIPYNIKHGDPLAGTPNLDPIGDITVPIVVLADINSVSMGELTTQAIAQMPNGCFIGERTFGGHGPLFRHLFEVNYAGPIETTNHIVYTSNDVFRDADGKITEGIGYTPTYEVLYDEEKMRAGIDVQLNAALNYIRTGSIN